MNIILDVILVAIIAIYLISGWRKGFVTTVMNLASFVIAGIGAYFLYGFPARLLCNGFFLPKLTSLIESSILSSAPGASAGELFASRPQFFVDILNKFSSESEVTQFYASGDSVSLTDVSRFMAEPLARTISNIICFAVCFILLLVVLHFVTKLLDKICHLPVLRTANSLLGIAVGGLLGLLFAWLLAALIGWLWPPLSTAYPETFSPNAISDSILLKWLCNFNPLTLFKA